MSPCRAWESTTPGGRPSSLEPLLALFHAQMSSPLGMPRSVCTALAFLLLFFVLLQALQSGRHLCCQAQAFCICDCPAPIGCSGHRCIASCTNEQALDQLTLLCCWLQLLLSASACSQALQLSEIGILHLQPTQMPQIVGSNPHASLLACLQEMQIVPSIRVESLTEDPEHNDIYSAYNKPGAVVFWLRVSHQVPLACLDCLTLPAAALCRACVSRWLPSCLSVCFTLLGAVKCCPWVSQWLQHCLFGCMMVWSCAVPASGRPVATAPFACLASLSSLQADANTLKLCQF